MRGSFLWSIVVRVVVGALGFLSSDPGRVKLSFNDPIFTGPVHGERSEQETSPGHWRSSGWDCPSGFGSGWTDGPSRTESGRHLPPCRSTYLPDPREVRVESK